jgi:hypothetical protein
MERGEVDRGLPLRPSSCDLGTRSHRPRMVQGEEGEFTEFTTHEDEVFF